jgi:hypothetical protein
MELILLVLFMFLVIRALSSGLRGLMVVREKTAQEALHDQIQQAMNWRPERCHCVKMVNIVMHMEKKVFV